MAQLDITTEYAESLWGEHELSTDDLGPWLTFAFTLEDGTLAALVREVHNAPNPGYILTVIGPKESRDALTEFLTESGLSPERVLHEGFD
ncbi:hypothetical protein [Streptomyces syringium]|uniref:Uncharacterized protein n=1 Tax=Streptomyces syringium TaxID=76729 RepID=A0ABS4Y7I1_9ACTN|nr:hypothetical protein [Streptomyces syringium]MBP2404731.1 hypothetical protein [Streptomyces syringium]